MGVGAEPILDYSNRSREVCRQGAGEVPISFVMIVAEQFSLF